MKEKIIAIWLFTIMVGCSKDPYPVYNEGEVLWQLEGEWSYDSGAEMEPLMSPDGQSFIYVNVYSKQSDFFSLMKYNLITNMSSTLHPFGYALDISPDGQWVAFNSNYGVISKIKLNGDSLQILTANEDFSPTWHPNNKSIVYYHSSGNVNDPGGMFLLRDDNSKSLVAVSAGHPDFFPDGNKIISTKGFDQTVWKKFLIHDINTKTEIARLDGSVNENNSNPKVSPDGKEILFVDYKSIYNMQADGRGLKRILPYKHFYENKQGDYLGFLASSPSWHPDGKHIIYQHFAITEHWTCPTGFNCTDLETFKGIVSIRKLKVRD